MSVILASKARLIMKLRKSGVTDPKVLLAIEDVPREVFVQPTFYDQAYEDMALPIALGQTISQPLVVAMMTQMLELNDRHKVLEIGTGSGYQASILSKICRRVYSIERHRPLLKTAEERFTALRIRNITCKVGDGMKGWTEQAPFDRIIVTAAAFREPPVPLMEQLSVGGIMVIPIGTDNSNQFIYRITREENGCRYEKVAPTRFVPLLPEIADEKKPSKNRSDINSMGEDYSNSILYRRKELALQN